MTILRSGQLRFDRLPRRVGLAPFDLVETQKIGLNRLQPRNLVLSDAARQLRAPFKPVAQAFSRRDLGRRRVIHRALDILIPAKNFIENRAPLLPPQQRPSGQSPA